MQVHGQNEYILISRLPSLFETAEHTITDWGFNAQVAVDSVEVAQCETNVV
jgi:hypothetical protein